ncbi:acyl-CoA carboxylase subunit epsilon [Frondihabitans cladoniiphilus]|uniref:Acyl-CoA carboxylase epsilon subunit-like protein n=1 Tax=Frondihabitans cladoniiphilus TaxID=715785 RepID=A0ABP8WE63_9MICO
MTTASSPESGSAEPTIRVVSGDPDAAELAAVTAVLASLEAENAARAAAAETVEGPTAWRRSQRSLRGPVEPGPGRWRDGRP